jgi:hypothetical protein
MTTHRHIQIHNLLDTASCKAGQCRRGADNLARINNSKGATHLLRRAMRLERIASTCASLLGVA